MEGEDEEEYEDEEYADDESASVYYRRARARLDHSYPSRCTAADGKTCSDGWAARCGGGVGPLVKGVQGPAGPPR